VPAVVATAKTNTTRAKKRVKRAEIMQGIGKEIIKPYFRTY
jgi:hypothetical protein